MIFLRRRAILSGLFGNSRRWLMVGGAAWVLHWIGRLFSGPDPSPRYTRELKAGERVIVIHEPESPAARKRARKRAAKAARKAARSAR